MKYMKQIGVISTIAFIAELLHFAIPLPIPASVYGMAILFFCLCLGIIKMEMVEDVADWILSIMPIFFIAPTVGLIEAFGDIQGQVIPLVLMCFISTVVVTSITGLTAQAIIRLRKDKKEEKKMNDILLSSTFFGVSISLLTYFLGMFLRKNLIKIKRV